MHDADRPGGKATGVATRSQTRYPASVRVGESFRFYLLSIFAVLFLPLAANGTKKSGFQTLYDAYNSPEAKPPDLSTLAGRAWTGRCFNKTDPNIPFGALFGIVTDATRGPLISPISRACIEFDPDTVKVTSFDSFGLRQALAELGRGSNAVAPVTEFETHFVSKSTRVPVYASFKTYKDFIVAMYVCEPGKHFESTWCVQTYASYVEAMCYFFNQLGT